DVVDEVPGARERRVELARVLLGEVVRDLGPQAVAPDDAQPDPDGERPVLAPARELLAVRLEGVGDELADAGRRLRAGDVHLYGVEQQRRQRHETRLDARADRDEPGAA